MEAHCNSKDFHCRCKTHGKPSQTNKSPSVWTLCLCRSPPRQAHQAWTWPPAWPASSQCESVWRIFAQFWKKAPLLCCLRRIMMLLGAKSSNGNLTANWPRQLCAWSSITYTQHAFLWEVRRLTSPSWTNRYDGVCHHLNKQTDTFSVLVLMRDVFSFERSQSFCADVHSHLIAFRPELLPFDFGSCRGGQSTVNMHVKKLFAVGPE